MCLNTGPGTVDIPRQHTNQLDAAVCSAGVRYHSSIGPTLGVEALGCGVGTCQLGVVVLLPSREFYILLHTPVLG